MNRHDNNAGSMGIPSDDGWDFSMQLPNVIGALPELAEAVETFGQQAGWTDAIIMQVNLVLEELAVNAITNGYPDGREGQIDIQIKTTAEAINIRITDDGNAFDPFTVAAPDLSLAVEDRPIGGLGIYLVRSYMDYCGYQYVQQRNQVSLTKRLPLSA